MTAPGRVTRAEVELALEAARGTEHFVGSTIPMENLLRRILDERDGLEAKVQDNVDFVLRFMSSRFCEEHEAEARASTPREFVEQEEVLGCPRCAHRKLATARRDTFREALDKLAEIDLGFTVETIHPDTHERTVRPVVETARLRDWLSAQAEGERG